MANETKSGTALKGNTMVGLLVEIFVISIFLGNLVILIVLKLYKPLTIPDVLVLSLALSDFLNVSFPVQILNLTSNIIKKSYTEEVCIIYVWATYTLRLASVMTVSVICIDRWIAIIKPLYYRSKVMPEVTKVKIFIALLWLLAALFALPPHIGLGSTGFSKGFCFYQLLDLGLGYGIFIEIIGLAQLALVLYCYISIKISTTSFLRRQSKMRSAESVSESGAQFKTSLSLKSKQGSTKMGTQQKIFGRQDTRHLGPPSKFSSHLSVSGSQRPGMTEGIKQVAKVERMMAAVVILYYISWLPFLISNLLSLITGKSSPLIVTVVGFFSLINGLVNPIVYGTLNPRYRKGYGYILRKILTICGGKQPVMTLADFDAGLRQTKRNLQNVQKMRSISVYENSTRSSRVYSSSSNSSRSSFCGDQEHDALSQKPSKTSSIRNNNNSTGVIFHIPITEENENGEDDVFESKLKEDTLNDNRSLSISPVTTMTDIDMESKQEGECLKMNGSYGSLEGETSSVSKSPPVIMSYSLSSHLENYANSCTLETSSSNVDENLKRKQSIDAEVGRINPGFEGISNESGEGIISQDEQNMHHLGFVDDNACTDVTTNGNHKKEEFIADEKIGYVNTIQQDVVLEESSDNVSSDEKRKNLSNYDSEDLLLESKQTIHGQDQIRQILESNNTEIQIENGNPLDAKHSYENNMKHSYDSPNLAFNRDDNTKL